MTSPKRLDIKEVGDVTVVRFREPRITDPLEIEELGKELYQVLEVKNSSKLVLDFSAVEFLSSATLGKLISLNRKVRLCKSALRLCNIRPPIMEIFKLCDLQRIFDIRASEPDALVSFA